MLEKDRFILFSAGWKNSFCFGRRSMWGRLKHLRENIQASVRSAACEIVWLVWHKCWVVKWILTNCAVFLCVLHLYRNCLAATNPLLSSSGSPTTANQWKPPGSWPAIQSQWVYFKCTSAETSLLISKPSNDVKAGQDMDPVNFCGPESNVWNIRLQQLASNVGADS